MILHLLFYFSVYFSTFPFSFSIFLEKPEIVASPHDMHLTPGETVELPCRMVGDPEPEIVWMQNTNEISADYSPKMKIMSTGALKINAVDANDIGIYECIGRNEVGETRTQPIRMMVEGQEQQHNNNYNDNNRQWNGQQQQPGQQRNIDNNGVGQQHPQQPHRVPLSSNRVVGNEQPPHFIHTPMDRIVALNGDAARLDCMAMGIPEPDIQWYFNGRLVAQSTDELRIQANGSLVIVQPTLLQAGVYRCEATNHLGTVQSTATIQVKGKCQSVSLGVCVRERMCKRRENGNRSCILFKVKHSILRIKI